MHNEKGHRVHCLMHIFAAYIQQPVHPHSIYTRRCNTLKRNHVSPRPLLHLDTIPLMPPPCNTSSLPDSDVDASSSPPSHNDISHQQAAPVSEDRREQPLGGCWRLPTVGLDASQPSGIFSNPIVPTTISQLACSASRTRDLIRPGSVLHAGSGSLPSQEQSFPSRRRRSSFMRHYSEPIIRTFPAQTEPSPFLLSSATETQNQQQQLLLLRSSQYDITRILPSQTVSADRGSGIADTSEYVSL